MGGGAEAPQLPLWRRRWWRHHFVSGGAKLCLKKAHYCKEDEKIGRGGGAEAPQLPHSDGDTILRVRELNMFKRETYREWHGHWQNKMF